MSKLAIDGGTLVFAAKANVPAWPPADEETAEQLKEIYLSHAWSFYGKHEVAFNEEFAAYTGAASCAMMANGTVTLEVAMQALGIGPGDEVIVPAYTWLATGTAVVVVGATPVVVDIEPDTYCIDPVEVEKAITPKTRAIIPVHLYGSMADMDKIMEIARKHNLSVIEDCAHAHGSEWAGKHAGTIGDVGSFSFQQSKTIASGEGGACITNDPALGEAMGRISHIGYQYGAVQGQATEPPPMGMISHNYRITEFQAAILRSQLRTLRADTEFRARNAETLRKKLNAIPGIKVQSPGRRVTLQGYYQYAMTLDPAFLKEGITREQFCAALRAEGVGCGPGGWGNLMFRQRLWSVPEDLYRVVSYKTAEKIVKEQLITLSLVWLMLSEEETNKVADAFEKVMAEYGR